MSNSRATARRRQKRNNSPGNRFWIWGVALVAPILVVFVILYNQSSRSDASATDGALLAETPAPKVAATLTAAEHITTSLAPDAIIPTSRLVAGPADSCRRHPRFARQLGFNERAILTTSAPTIKGLALIQPAEATVQEQIFQDPSWTTAGYLGHMTFDPNGNVYLFPSPRVSLVENPPEEQNTLYRVDTDSAKMVPLLTISTDAPATASNPFGIMGTTYDCDTNSLYVSTVAGSTVAVELGKIVRIDLTTETIVAELQGIDPFGLSVFNQIEPRQTTEGISNTTAVTNENMTSMVKRLYFGAARTAEVYSILLNDQGDFVGQPTLEFALPNSALKPWRFAWDSNGDLIVRAMPFDYNLIATSERVEVPFRFRQDDEGLWQWIEE